MQHYIIIERERSADLAIEYPDFETAEHAIDNSLFIDGLCEEDCLDAYIVGDDEMPELRPYLQNLETIIPKETA